MTSYYFDSSALGKRYVQETGTDWVRMPVDPKAGHTLLTARITMVEIYSVLARRKREGSVPAADCDTASRAFTAHSATDYDFIELDMTTINLSRNLLNRYPLRAYDAVQLASALVANQVLQSANLSPLIFVSADNRLNDAALTEGLTVDNPNLHP